ncbi:MAG: contact-dependent growth inhibition system immunity protein [Jatrophihabitantaceae bacterium]
MTDYPLLWQFFGGYLNEDWPDEYANEWAAVDAFARDAPAKVDAFRSEIAALLAEHPMEEDVRKLVFDDLASCYLAEVDGWKYRDWLKALSDHAAKVVRHPRAS